MKQNRIVRDLLSDIGTEKCYILSLEIQALFGFFVGGTITFFFFALKSLVQLGQLSLGLRVRL